MHNIMKKICFILFAVFMGFNFCFAQGKDHDKEKMVKEVYEFKLKFLAQEMELKEDQQQKFFDIYNEMNEKRRAAYKDFYTLKKKLKDNPNASDEDYKRLREAEQKANEQSALIEKEYDKKFGEFLSEKQMYKMKEGENKFRNKIQEMKHNKKKHKKQPLPASK